MNSRAEPIRVLHIIHELGDGGADRALSRLVNASDPARVRHTILSLRRGRGYGRMRRGVTMLYAGVGESAQARTLTGLLRRHRFDLVHGWTVHASIMAAQIAGALGLPLVQRQPVNMELELQYEAAFTATYWRELRLAHAAADAVIVPSSALVDSTRRLCGVTPVVISNAVDVDAIPAWRPRRRGGRPFEFGLVGRLCRQKDPMTLVEALPHLHASIEWRLRIFGDGYLRQAVEARLDALGLSDHVTFEGFDQQWVSADFDAFVFPTRYEGMSNALLEAAAAGMPIVASAIPENRVVLGHGTQALLAPAGDALAFARAMTVMAVDPDYGATLGARAREHARTFSFNSMVRSHEALYARLTRPRVPRRAA